MTTLQFQSGRLAPAQWTRVARLIRAYRRDHDSMTQEEFAARLTRAVHDAARQAAPGAAAGIRERFTKDGISRIEAWGRPPERTRPRRVPMIAHTVELEGLAALLGMRAEDMLGAPAAGRMQGFALDAPRAQVAVLGETLRRHEPGADQAIVWSRHLISMFFPTEALYAYYRANYDDAEAAENWVAAAEERREAVLGRAPRRRWSFTHVLFASDLHEVVAGEGRFAGIGPGLRAACLEGLRRAVTDTPRCHLAVLDDEANAAGPAIAGLRRDVGAFTHLSNMGDGCVILHDLLGVWHVGENVRDVRAYRQILSELVEAARYRERREVEPYLDSLIQRTLRHD